MKSENKRKRTIHPVAMFVAAHVAAVGFISIAAATLGDAYAPDNGSPASYIRLVPLEEGTYRKSVPRTYASKGETKSRSAYELPSTFNYSTRNSLDL
jgi:hypothetical protein